MDRNSKKPSNPHRPPTKNRGNLPQPAAVNRVSRGQALRAQKRNQEDAHKLMNQYAPAVQAPEGQGQHANQTATDDLNKLKITYLGGQDSIGEKNMQVVEWQNDATILDCGNDLSVDL